MVLPCRDRAHVVEMSPFQPFAPVILCNKEALFDEDWIHVSQKFGLTSHQSRRRLDLLRFHLCCLVRKTERTD